MKRAKSAAKGRAKPKQGGARAKRATTILGHMERARKRLQLARAIAEMRRGAKRVALVQERARFVREARESPQKVREFLEGMEVPRVEALEDSALRAKEREKGKSEGK